MNTSARIVLLAALGFAASGAIAQTTAPRPGGPQPEQGSPPGSAAAAPVRQPAVTPGVSPGSPSAATTTPKLTLESLDRDRNGSISQGEASADQQLSRDFQQLDRNRDGKLDAGEFPGTRN